MLFFESFPEFLQIPGRETQCDLDFRSLLFCQAYFFGQILAFGLGSAIVLQFHVKIQGNIRAIRLQAAIERAHIAFFDHIGGPSYFLLAFLSPDCVMLFLGFLQLCNFLIEDLVAIGVLFDFGDHDLVEEIDLPELLVIATFFIVFGINYLTTKVLGSVE